MPFATSFAKSVGRRLFGAPTACVRPLEALFPWPRYDRKRA